MKLFASLASPKVLKLGLASTGVEKVRIDYDPVTGEMVLTAIVAGEIRQVRVPCGVIFTADEIAAWLAGENPFVPESADKQPAEPVTS